MCHKRPTNLYHYHMLKAKQSHRRMDIQQFNSRHEQLDYLYKGFVYSDEGLLKTSQTLWIS